MTKKINNVPKTPFPILENIERHDVEKAKELYCIDHNYDNFHKRKSFLENEIKCRLNAL